MTYEELLPVRERLNRLLKGKPLPNTFWTIRDFVIMPGTEHVAKAHQNFIAAVEIGVSLNEVELAVKNRADLEIRIRLKNKEMKGFYTTGDLKVSFEELEKKTTN